MAEQSPEELAVGLIELRRAMTLATAGDGPWAAPVYYLFRSGRFYFISSPRSRHIAELGPGGRCAAAIYHESDDWREIEGLQMDGRVAAVGLGAEAAEAFAGYVARFPTVRGFFDGPFDLGDLLDKFRSRLYAFEPERVFYLNNRAGFGKRIEIRLPG